jgi:hypothetical protein
MATQMIHDVDNLTKTAAEEEDAKSETSESEHSQ